MDSILTKKNITIASIVGGTALATIGALSYIQFKSENDKILAVEAQKAALEKDIYDDDTIIKIYKKWSKDLYPIYNVIQIKSRELLRQMDARGPRPERWKEQLIMVLTQKGNFHDYSEAYNYSRSILFQLKH